MNYKLAKGVVLLNICDSYFLFPSRNSGISVPFLVTAAEELVSVLNSRISENDIQEKTKQKLSRLLRMGYIEEY